MRYAGVHGNAAAIERVIAAARLHKLTAALPAGAAEAFGCKPGVEGPVAEGPFAAATTKGGAAPLRGGTEAGEDDISLAKGALKAARRAAHAQGALLTFADAGVEARYCRWYHSGQVPVDMAFMAVALVSQLSWVFRWALHGGLAGAGMQLLMALNFVLLAAAVGNPGAYAARRDALCAASHVAHKRVQLLVTVMPGAGTLHALSYNRTGGWRGGGLAGWSLAGWPGGRAGCLGGLGMKLLSVVPLSASVVPLSASDLRCFPAHPPPLQSRCWRAAPLRRWRCSPLASRCASRCSSL